MPFLLLLSLVFGQQAAPGVEALHAAAKAGDKAGVERALAAGVPVDAPTRYQQTALMFASQFGHPEIVALLLEKGANPSQKDTFYGVTVMTAPGMSGAQPNPRIMQMLIEKGADTPNAALGSAVQTKDQALLKAVLASPHLNTAQLARFLTTAEAGGDAAIIAMLKEAAAKAPAPAAPSYVVAPALLQTYAGPYRNEDQGMNATVAIKDGKAALSINGQPDLVLKPRAEGVFELEVAANTTVTFSGRGGSIERMAIAGPQANFTLVRVAPGTPAASAAAPAATPAADLAALKTPSPVTEAKPWPSFRGPNASGNADGQGAPVEWDVKAGKNLKWRTELPGFTNASPLVVGDRVYAITAISSANDRTFKTGNYGDVASVEDMSVHTWRIYALDAKTGAIAWDKEIFTGAPKVKRHTKSTQANSTPATDGKTIVSVFGSIGLMVAHDLQGKELWRTDIGIVDSGWFFDAGVQWGHSSSPIIYGNTVVAQIDQQKNSFIAAYDLATGKQVWKTMREDEIPTWATPTIATGPKGDEIVTNGTKVRGYDAKTGAQLWTLGPNSEITVGTPVVEGGIAYITGGYPPVRTVYAVKVGSRGDLSMPKGTTSSDAIQWSNNEGTYIPSPIVYRGILYMFNNNGILTAFNAETGERVMRARVGGGGAFSGSPIAADGRLYFTSEDGDVYVVKAGAPYLEIAKNPVGEVIMTTPAVSNGTMYIRTMGGVVAIGGR
ncbi:MAG: PQQ-binding-like beta-propeller repeat protein [Acidobacteriota bacterium]|nr:PQQ-binding-like beta-propeller repeat protein [Acidobacteriota bacterium]